MNPAHRLAAVAAIFLAAFPLRTSAQSIPAERPRARPPSALTGWADWEKGAELLRRIKVPPAPPLSPEEAMKTFRVAPGFRLELVASEPLVQNPIFFEFDPEGRIWVVEYQGYMRDVAGSGEGEPICRVVVLEDTDGDGRAEKSTVFLDHLVMPRSFAFVQGGVLLQEPPRLWFCADTDGDLRCDKRTEVGKMGAAGNPQHTANGLRYGLDNWLHNADWPKRHRWVDGKLIEAETMHRGQFGVTFDETGRFFSCYENSALHADLIPAEYLVRNRHLSQVLARGERGASGVSVNIATEAKEVFPIRVTPAVTLGALELRDDGRLRTYTIAAGVCSYDGDQFPDDARGNVFVPESGGHLLGRLQLTAGIRPKATRFYPAEQEFLASTDERFRPVNARVGPDGALYIADLYHGIIEHVIFMVPWLSDQIRDRQLGTGNDLGRIYRVVREDRPLDHCRPNLTQASSAELVSHLSHANGWWRLTAQRLLVERRDPAATPLLTDLALHGRSALGRLHALWTLDGFEALDAETKFAALGDVDERVRAAALRLSERGLDAKQQTALLVKLGPLVDDRSEMVRLQATLTASALPQTDALPLVARLAATGDDALFRTAALTGLEGRELEFVRLLLESGEPQSRLVILAAQCVMQAGDATQIAALFETLDRVSGASPRDALLEAMASFAPTGGRRAKPVTLRAEPTVLIKLARGGDARVRQTAYRVMELFTWPGAAPLAAEGMDVAALSLAEQKRLAAGREPFTIFCAPCHQPHGGGAANVAPPLAGSDWLAGPPERLARIVLHGLYGPVEVNGQTWNLHMPGLGATGLLDDEKLAAILSYVRRAWGNSASPVEPALIAAIRRHPPRHRRPHPALDRRRTRRDRRHRCSRRHLRTATPAAALRRNPPAREQGHRLRAAARVSARARHSRPVDRRGGSRGMARGIAGGRDVRSQREPRRRRCLGRRLLCHRNGRQPHARGRALHRRLRPLPRASLWPPDPARGREPHPDAPRWPAETGARRRARSAAGAGSILAEPTIDGLPEVFARSASLSLSRRLGSKSCQ